MTIDTIVSDPSLTAVLQISGHAREQAAALLALLTQASEQETVSPEIQTEISKQQRLLFTNISHLRGLHRSAYFSARETKGQTAEARQAVDRLHLQLQNLYYEQGHLQVEIDACGSYKYVSIPPA
jgi:THO complex subunit 5